MFVGHTLLAVALAGCVLSYCSAGLPFTVGLISSYCWWVVAVTFSVTMWFGEEMCGLAATHWAPSALNSCLVLPGWFGLLCHSRNGHWGCWFKTLHTKPASLRNLQTMVMFWGFEAEQMVSCVSSYSATCVFATALGLSLAFTLFINCGG